MVHLQTCLRIPSQCFRITGTGTSFYIPVLIYSRKCYQSILNCHCQIEKHLYFYADLTDSLAVSLYDGYRYRINRAKKAEIQEEIYLNTKQDLAQTM